MDNDTPAYRKKKGSSTSKSKNRSNHKHEYELCVTHFVLPAWGERCKICGRTYTLSYGKRKTMDSLLRPEDEGKSAVGIRHYLTVAEIKQKYPGIHAYDWTPDGYVEVESWEGD